MPGTNSKKKPYGALLLMGVLSAALYIALLSRQDTILHYFGRGGLHALLPVGTAFVFSFVHGSFTGAFWTALGIEASKKKREAK